MSGSAVKERFRIKFDAKSQALHPMEGSIGGNIKHMEQVEGLIAGLTMPTDYTSPAFLQTNPSENRSKGKLLTLGTRGVKEFISGDISHYRTFIAGIIRAQRSI